MTWPALPVFVKARDMQVKTGPTAKLKHPSCTLFYCPSTFNAESAKRDKSFVAGGIEKRAAFQIRGEPFIGESSRRIGLPHHELVPYRINQSSVERGRCAHAAGPCGSWKGTNGNNRQRGRAPVHMPPTITSATGILPVSAPLVPSLATSLPSVS